MKKTSRRKLRSKWRRQSDREGAAMLIVMLLLLTTTSLAVFAVQATSYEVRASGFARQSMQSEYVAEAGLTSVLTVVDKLGPQAILYAIQQQQANPTTYPPPVMSPFEPELATSATSTRPAEAYRMQSEDLSSFTTTGTEPVDRAAIGARQTYEPSFAVDIYDHHITSRPIPGYPVGSGGLSFFHAIYTSRGRMRLDGGDTAVSGPDPRQYHETASAARAYGVSGPFAR